VEKEIYLSFHFFILSVCFISGKQTCYSGWKAEYTGILMTEHKNHNNKDYVCLDKEAEPIDTDARSQNGALFYAVRTTCGFPNIIEIFYKLKASFVCYVK
jgi:hypothetical protein